MSYKGEFIVQEVLFLETGESRSTGKQWKKQSLILETGGRYSKTVKMDFWGDLTDRVKDFSPGDTITVEFDAESREYNGKWYTDLKAWKIEGEGSGGGPVAGGAQAEADNMADMAPVNTDDLPF